MVRNWLHRDPKGSLDFGRDFACVLRRPQNGSTSTCTHPRLRGLARRSGRQGMESIVVRFVGTARDYEAGRFLADPETEAGAILLAMANKTRYNTRRYSGCKAE